MAVLGEISSLTEKRRYDEALQKVDLLYGNNSKVQEGKNPFLVERKDLKDSVVNIILWHKYSDESYAQNLSFQDISRFVGDNQFYPNIDDLRKTAQTVVIKDSVPYHLSQQYFKLNQADNVDTKIYLIDSKSQYLLRYKGLEVDKNKIAQEIQESIVSAWVDEDFDATQEREFLHKYSDKLNIVDHVNRINRLLWDSRFDDAKRIMNFVNDDHQRLFNAIIKIRALPKYISNIILSVPRKFRSDEQLIYSRILWYKSQGKEDKIADLLARVSEMKYPERWWGLRHLYSREMLKKKKYKLAYILAKNHGLTPNQERFWEASWLSGWIALRFLKLPNEAYNYFENLYNNVRQPVTVARAAYWLGMTSEALEEKEKAVAWYKIAAKFPVYFYGQLAIHKHRMLDPLNAKKDIILPQPPGIRVGDARKIAVDKAAQIAYLMALMGDKTNAVKIFEYVIKKANTDGQIAVVMRLVNEVGDMAMDVKLSRAAERKNVFFIKDKFQIIKSIKDDEYAPMVHAIIKQESGFAPSALSSVGAVGFMQIMPDTAKKVASDLNIKYSRHKLVTDVDYNIKLGSHYIKQMVEKFDGSEMLAIASYNAGPNATLRWIDEFYDPRDEKDLDKVVDWIELITYSETRNYVQRIMENLIVYKYLMSRKGYDEVK